jgi:hypothetical protein
MPQRIQRKRTKGWKMPPGAVYVGRPTKWGNENKIGDPYPFVEDHLNTREDVINLYEINLMELDKHGKLDEYLAPLRGKDLASA